MALQKWTKKEEKLLAKLWSTAPREDIERELSDRTWYAITSKAQSLGLSRQTDDKWSDGELCTLIDLWSKSKPREVLQEFLPERSWGSIRAKASSLNLNTLRVNRPVQDNNKMVIDDIRIKGNTFKFGIVSDTHLGSRYSQITYLHQMYDVFNEEGVDVVFHAGDISEGNGKHFPGQQFEMHINGADALRDFIVKVYPRLKSGGKTYVVAGYHDLDLWIKEGYDLLQHVEEKREDIVYLGQASCTVDMFGKKIEIMHPSGGTAYALSYRMQKIAESFSSENKPNILILGHYHKAEYVPILRNIFGFQAGCYQAQTPFAKRKNINFQYGGWIVEMGINDNGISRMQSEFIPFYKPIPNDFKNFE